MTLSRPAFRPGRLLASGMVLALLISILPLASATAAITAGPIAGSPVLISADKAQNGTAPGTTAIDGPTLTGTVGTDFPAGGTIIMNAPANFVFQASTGSIGVTSGCTGIVLGAQSVTTTQASASITTAPTGACTLKFTGLLIQPVNANTLSVAGLDITNTGTISPGNYGKVGVVPGAPILSFTQRPTGSLNTGGVAFPLLQQPIVNDVDAYGHARTGDFIQLTITPATGAVGANLSCSVNPAPTNGSGNANFAGCMIDLAGNNYRLHATTTGATPVDSPLAAFDIIVGPAAQLVFSSYPSAATASNLTPTPTVAIEDAGGNVRITDTSNVTLAINQNSGTFTCIGGLTRAAVGGFAAFTCTQTVAASGYQITASTTTPVLSKLGVPFAVTSGPPTKLALCWGTALVCNTTPPASITGGSPFSLQPEVRLQDALGNTVVSDNSTVVTLAIATGTPTSGGPGALTCTTSNTKTLTAGVAVYSGCSIDKVGSNYQLVATSAPAYTSATSTVFNVTTGAATKLAFLTTPGTPAAGSVFATNPVVAIQDAGGNTVTTGIAATITLAIGTNPGGGVLSCTGGLSVTTVNGLATFNGCSITNAGVGYTLTATATAVVPVTTLASATTAAFTVVAPAAMITVSASAPTITWGQTVIISVHFAINGANKTFRLEGARDPNNLANFALIANLTTNAAGDATFAYTPPTNLFYRAVFAGAPDLSASISPQTRVVVRQIAILRPTNNGATRTVNKGTVVLFTTTVRPSRPELTPAVVIYTVFQLKNGTWVQVLARNVTATAAGLAQLSITFSTPGSFYVRSQANPTPYNANSVNSPLQFYNVNS